MARYSTKGWYIGTAIRVGRCFREFILRSDGNQLIVQQTAVQVSAILAMRMNWFDITYVSPEDNPRAGEYYWTFWQKDEHGQFVGSFVTFIAPMGADIHRIRAEHVEAKKKARRAAAERSEIRRAMSPVAKNRPSHSNAVTSKRRL
jgi:hypothetical protein